MRRCGYRPANQIPDVIWTLSPALAADEIAFGERQEYAVYSQVIFGAVQDLGLDAGGSYVIDNEQSTGHKRSVALTLFKSTSP